MKLKEYNVRDELSRLNQLLTTYALNMTLSQEYSQEIGQRLKKLAKECKDSNVKEELELVIADIDNHRRKQTVWAKFEHDFSAVHVDFLKTIRDDFPDLTTQDQKLCAYLRMNLDTNEIAKLLNISVRGVEVARYRLRKRLHLKTKQNLTTFIMKL